MMGQKQRDEVDVERRDDPFASIWTQVTSEFGVFFTQDSEAEATSLLDVSTAAESTPTSAVPLLPTEEMTTASELIPISTLTVEETSFRTTFVTVPATTESSATRTPISSATQKATSCTSPTTAVVPTAHLSSSSARSEPSPLPPLVTNSEPSGTASGTATSNAQESASAPSSTAAAATSVPSQRTAVIGGLSGSIAGLFLIGIFACLWWRRRKPRFDDDDTESLSEKGLRPAFARQWSGITSNFRTPQPPLPVASRGSTPEPEPDGVLRVSMDNWARPYAHDNGYRESQGPTTLRVMNPDLSRPTTPLRPSLETAGSFLKRQRNALAAALYGRPSSRAGSPQRSLQPPNNNIDSALSTEFLAPKAVVPSVRSATTNDSLPVVVQQPPEDPFLTPPDESAERDDYTVKAPAATASAGPARPGIAPLQSSSGATRGRTLSGLGNSLNPFRTRSNASTTSRSVSRHSTSTWSSAGDPFMLDRPSLPSSHPRGAPKTERGRSGNLMMYEGT